MTAECGLTSSHMWLDHVARYKGCYPRKHAIKQEDVRLYRAQPHGKVHEMAITWVSNRAQVMLTWGISLCREVTA